MTRNTQVCLLVGTIALAAVMGGFIYASVERAKIEAEVRAKQIETEAKINAQTEVERVLIEQKAATERTREWMNFIPWYKGGENK